MNNPKKWQARHNHKCHVLAHGIADGVVGSVHFIPRFVLCQATALRTWLIFLMTGRH